MRKKEVIVGAGIILVVLGALAAVSSFQTQATGESFFAAVRSPLVTREVENQVKASAVRYTHSLVALEPPSRALTVEGMAVKSQELRAFSVARLKPLGVRLERQEVLPMFNMIVALIPIESMDDVSRLRRVRAVAKNRRIRVRPLSSSTVYPEIGDVVKFHEAGELPSAEGVTVGLVDSATADEPWVAQAVSVTDKEPTEGFWHGKVVAKIVHSYAPEARIVAVEALDEYGSARLSTVMKGMSEVAKMDVDIINMSLGSSPSAFSPLNRAADVLSREYGIILTVSSGNTMGKMEMSPANAGSTLSVGALAGTMDRVADYSSSEYDVLVTGTVKVAHRETRGTSFSSPGMAGMVARYLAEHPDVDWGKIDFKATVMGAGLQEATTTGLPIAKGSVLAQVEPEMKPSATETLLPWVAVSLIGAAMIVYGARRWT